MLIKAPLKCSFQLFKGLDRFLRKVLSISVRCLRKLSFLESLKIVLDNRHLSAYDRDGKSCYICVLK